MPKRRSWRRIGTFLFGLAVVTYAVATVYLANEKLVKGDMSTAIMDQRTDLRLLMNQSGTFEKANSTNVILTRSKTDRSNQNPTFLPPLRDIINLTSGNMLKKPPQKILDFVIVGHGKCGTTSMKEWLATKTEEGLIYLPDEEVLELSLGTKAQFLSRMYEEYKTNPGKELYGYKNPGEIRIPNSIRFLHDYFPLTTLIVGIRHPVLWFESLYNFKVQNLPPQFASDHWGDPNDLIGKCDNPRIFNCVGTHKGLFHVHLAMLGKTDQTQSLEEKYTSLLFDNIIKTSNPVFLFDVDQLKDGNRTRIDRLGRDILDLLISKKKEYATSYSFSSKVLNVTSDISYLGPLPRISPGKKIPKRRQKLRDKAKIRICDDKYKRVREELLSMAREASEWIRNSGFLDDPDVHVSSKDHFLDEILGRRWMKDPCGEAG